MPHFVAGAATTEVMSGSDCAQVFRVKSWVSQFVRTARTTHVYDLISEQLPVSTCDTTSFRFCQDFVHLSLIVLRGMGIPARYVSGYHHPGAEAVVGETVDGHSHAWIQAWTGGWWDLDPTNDSEITEQYVSVGVGRDYSDVSPLKGIYSGQGATDLDVVVEITRLA